MSKKRYDYVEAIWTAHNDGGTKHVKRVLRKLVRDSVSKALRDRTGDTFAECDEAADRVAKEMIP